MIPVHESAGYVVDTQFSTLMETHKEKTCETDLRVPSPGAGKLPPTPILTG